MKERVRITTFDGSGGEVMFQRIKAGGGHVRILGEIPIGVEETSDSYT
jgi:hypothetical protein